MKSAERARRKGAAGEEAEAKAEEAAQEVHGAGGRVCEGACDL